MSEIKLVRCPKCDKVLPEPPVFTVYKCGGCGAVLQAKKKSSGSDNLVNSELGFDKGKKGEEGVQYSGESREVEGEGVVLREGNFDMGSKSPLRSAIGDGSGIESFGESDLNEFHGGFPKSPMRDRFLNDLSSAPLRSRNVSPSPMRSRNVSPSPTRGRGSSELDDGGQTPARAREVSMSPLRGERGNRSPMSVRTRNFSRSPLREVDVATPARSQNENLANSPLRGDDVPSFDERAEKELEGVWGDCDEPEKGVRRDKMTAKTSFSSWLSDDNPPRESNDKEGRRRKKWKDVIGDDVDRISEGKESTNADEHGITSEGSVDDQTHGDMRFRGDYVRVHRRVKANIDQRFTGSDDGTGMMHTSLRVASKSKRNSVSSSTVDEPSRYHPESFSNYGHPRHSFETPRGPSNVPNMERIERTHNYQDFGGYSQGEHFRSRGGYMHQFSPDKTMPRSSYYNHGPGLAPEVEDAYNHFPLYEDPYAHSMGNEWFPKQPHFLQHPMPGYAPSPSMDFDRESFMSYNKGIHRHYPADSQSYDLPSSFGSRIPSNSMNLQRPGPGTYDPRMSHTAPRERSSHLAPHRARKVVATQDKRFCLPISGGSPFLLCYKCTELLKLPAKFKKKQKNEYKLQCGACSSIISFDLQKKSFGVPSSQEKPEIDSAAIGSGELLNKSGSRPGHHRGSFAATSTTIGSYDFDAGRHSFQSLESEGNESSRGRKMNSSNDGSIRGFFSSPHVSKEELVSNNASGRSSLHNSSETPVKVRPPPGSPLREHLDYSGQYHRPEPEYGRNDYGKEKKEFEKDTSQGSYVLNTTDASEAEVHSHGLSNSLSDSGDVSRDENCKDTQATKSPLWKSPFASKSVPASPGKDEVYVNGQLIPHHVVKKAEKLAGPIEPGDYWYDPKGGFWGVMGHPGCGILPPSIQEFTFPMPEGCSRGDTTVYVNGRELHKNDLDLLGQRGLPAIVNKRYIIDITGKVQEEQSKAFVANLGKLAPTIERVKRGFGMRVPPNLKD